MKDIKEKNKHIDKFSIREVSILLVITSVVSITTGFAVANRLLKDSSTDELAFSNEKLETFIKNYNYITTNYYGEFDEEKLLDAALSGVLEALGDPHTVYIDEDAVDNFNIQLRGNYTGLGIEIRSGDAGIIVSKVFENSPAALAGLNAGDYILEINNQDVTKFSAADFSNIIKSSEETIFNLNIKRNDDIKNIVIQKSSVIINSVTSKLYNKDNKKIGYLGISIFADNTYEQFRTELEKIENDNIDSLIIDVRNNTGGHLTSVESIISLFLDSSHVIYKMEDSTGITEYYSKGTQTKKYDIIILTNEVSASASEILTAALKEEYGAKSIGKKTYGKGSAQELRTLPDGTQYKITTHKWLTPSGNSIDGQGIDVDVEVDLNDEYLKNMIEENDNQLQAAFDLLLQ